MCSRRVSGQVESSTTTKSSCFFSPHLLDLFPMTGPPPAPGLISAQKLVLRSKPDVLLLFFGFPCGPHEEFGNLSDIKHSAGHPDRTGYYLLRRPIIAIYHFSIGTSRGFAGLKTTLRIFSNELQQKKKFCFSRNYNENQNNCANAIRVRKTCYAQKSSLSINPKKSTAICRNTVLLFVCVISVGSSTQVMNNYRFRTAQFVL